MAINKATDNVQYLESLKIFFDPLYGNINDIHNHLAALFKALRTVYNTSKFYNNSNAIAGFLVKCTNHLTIVCKNYVTNNGTMPIISQSLDEINAKIVVCGDLLKQYRDTYKSTMREMAKANEVIWNFSPNYVFGMVDLFMERLTKVSLSNSTEIF